MFDPRKKSCLQQLRPVAMRRRCAWIYEAVVFLPVPWGVLKNDDFFLGRAWWLDVVGWLVKPRFFDGF